MKEYTVKIKDLDQDMTHVVKQYAINQGDANRLALVILKELLETDNLEID